MLWQPPIPESYLTRSDEDLCESIRSRKAQLGSRLVVLGHHYQRDDVIQHADFTGDSFKLSQLAAERVQQSGAEYVLFCGVHFMAETADILTDESVKVILPDMNAGCSMADMATYEQVEDCYALLQESFTRQQLNVRCIPICYMNSTAAIKAFCGKHGGAVCTSSNCDKVFKWALAGGDTPLQQGEQVKILFVPDQHLGRNTASQSGFDTESDMCLWDPDAENGGIDDAALARSTFILWKGHCSVHKMFRPEHVDQVRAEWPDVKVIAHPECCIEVCQRAGMTGSTEGILQAVRASKPGDRWAVATEVHMVERLAAEMREKQVQVRMLSSCQCLCTTMVRIDQPHLLWVLDQLVEGKVPNVIQVHPEARQLASLSLERMLRITQS